MLKLSGSVNRLPRVMFQVLSDKSSLKRSSLPLESKSLVIISLSKTYTIYTQSIQLLQVLPRITSKATLEKYFYVYSKCQVLSCRDGDKRCNTEANTGISSHGVYRNLNVRSSGRASVRTERVPRVISDIGEPQRIHPCFSWRQSRTGRITLLCHQQNLVLLIFT